MKKLINTFIATALLASFSFSAFAEGPDLVSTDGAICSERTAGKDIQDKGKEKAESDSSSAAQN